MLHKIIKSTHFLPVKPETITHFIENSLVKSGTQVLPQRNNSLPIYLLIIFSLFGLPSSYVYAENETTTLPDNATAKSYGTGWNCDKGYRENDNTCSAVIIPANAYPTNKTYGRGWECNRGFKQIHETCSAINIPENAYLDDSGERIKCNRGYIYDNESCHAINVPKNGFLATSTYGPGWGCERGFRADKDTCVKLELPENSHIDYSGNNWECNKPYRQKQNKCTLPDN